MTLNMYTKMHLNSLLLKISFRNADELNLGDEKWLVRVKYQEELKLEL